MDICTIGFTKRKATEFFEPLKAIGIQRILDVRLNNVSQLAGFSKRDDLAYFTRELLGGTYKHEPLLAPTQELLDSYKKHKGSWDDYAQGFLALMKQRAIETAIDRSSFSVPSVLLCSEPLADRCHRRLVAEYLQSHWEGTTIRHL